MRHVVCRQLHFKVCKTVILNVAVREYEGKHLNEMRRDNREYVLHSLYCVHDNKGLILNDKCCGTNAFYYCVAF